MSFAKIHESAEYGQILVMKDTSDEGDPCVVFVFDPKIEGIEVLKSMLGFEDKKSGTELLEWQPLRGPNPLCA